MITITYTSPPCSVRWYRSPTPTWWLFVADEPAEATCLLPGAKLAP